MEIRGIRKMGKNIMRYGEGKIGPEKHGESRTIPRKSFDKELRKIVKREKDFQRKNNSNFCSSDIGNCSISKKNSIDKKKLSPLIYVYKKKTFKLNHFN